MAFRDRLFATLQAARPVLEQPGVLVVGSEVPNLLQPGAASTLVVSQDVDVGVPVESHAAVKARLADLRGLHPSAEEPSVWLPDDASLIELNFIGMDSSIRDASETYVLEDAELPLMVFGPLSLVRAGPVIRVGGVAIPLPKPAGLMLEKLLSDRTGGKGERDLLVVAGLLETATDGDVDELVETYRTLLPEQRHAVRSNATLLSLMGPLRTMPDPRPHRARLAAILRRLETEEHDP